MLTTLAVSGYRSLRDLVLPLARVTVVTGANGSGKSSLYRSLRLIADVGQGGVIRSLAQEGGLSSTLWAGPEAISRAMRQGRVPVQGTVRRSSVALRLGFSGVDYGFAIDLGYPVPAQSAFDFDPAIKLETMWTGPVLGRVNAIAERRGPSVRIRGEEHAWRQAFTTLAAVDSMLTHAADGRDGFELLGLRERLRAWRFYDQLRTDRDAPVRTSRIGSFTPALAADGSDLAAAIQTIREVGDGDAFDAAIDDALPGSRVEIAVTEGVFEVTMRQTGLLRALRTSELSDGTLRYLMLAAALTTPRPPDLMVLNEPETSLHPDLLEPLARMILGTPDVMQVIVVTHSGVLANALSAARDGLAIELVKDMGETTAPGLDRPSWQWPAR